MKYLLDTNICIYLIKQNDKKLIKKFNHYSPLNIGISSITVAELWYGVEKSKKQKENSSALNEFLHPFEIINFNSDSALIYGKIRSELEKLGKLIGSMDLLIASIALAENFVLVTNNEKEFKRVSKLKVENWVS